VKSVEKINSFGHVVILVVFVKTNLKNGVGGNHIKSSENPTGFSKKAIQRRKQRIKNKNRKNEQQFKCEICMNNIGPQFKTSVQDEQLCSSNVCLSECGHFICACCMTKQLAYRVLPTDPDFDRIIARKHSCCFCNAPILNGLEWLRSNTGNIEKDKQQLLTKYLMSLNM